MILIQVNKYNIQEIKHRISVETYGKMKDCKVLVLKPDSSMSEKIKMSSAFYNLMHENCQNLIKKGSMRRYCI